MGVGITMVVHVVVIVNWGIAQPAFHFSRHFFVRQGIRISIQKKTIKRRLSGPSAPSASLQHPPYPSSSTPHSTPSPSSAQIRSTATCHASISPSPAPVPAPRKASATAAARGSAVQAEPATEKAVLPATQCLVSARARAGQGSQWRQRTPTRSRG